MADTLVYVAYPVASVVVFLFGCFGMLVGYLHFRKSGKDSQEFFLTARDSAGLLRISFSFYAGVMGSWALFSAPSYSYTAGKPLLHTNLTQGPVFRIPHVVVDHMALWRQHKHNVQDPPILSFHALSLFVSTCSNSL